MSGEGPLVAPNGGHALPGDRNPSAGKERPVALVEDIPDVPACCRELSVQLALQPGHCETRIVDFGGFGEQAFEFFERVQSVDSWAAVQLLREDWDRGVHAPMEALLDQLGPEFGRDAYAYHLHKDPFLWSHQVGVITVADTIGYRLVLSVGGMVTEGGWMRSSADQVQRYRQAVSSGFGVEASILVAQARNEGLAILGQQLSRAPRGWPAGHPRIDLLKYRTLFASNRVPAASLASGPACIQAVTANLRVMRPLTEWLAEHVGPRRAH